MSSNVYNSHIMESNMNMNIEKLTEQRDKLEEYKEQVDEEEHRLETALSTVEKVQYELETAIEHIDAVIDALGSVALEEFTEEKINQRLKEASGIK